LAVLPAAVLRVKIASIIGSAVQRKPDEPIILQFDKINREFKESGRSKGREPAPERRFEDVLKLLPRSDPASLRPGRDLAPPEGRADLTSAGTADF
jgi:hypothetical protein